MPTRKRGRLSSAERQFIQDNTPELTPAEIAAKVGRTAETVAAYVAELKPPEPAAVAAVRVGLQSSMAWKNLTAEFDEAELRYFQERYVALKEQFKDDILPSEETQLFKCIKAELLMHRNLVQQKRAQAEIDRLESEREALMLKRQKAKLSPDESSLLVTTDTLLNVAHRSKQDRTSEYERLDKGHQDILKSLKSTREQRIAKIENNKRSLLDIIRMLQEEEARKRADAMIDMTLKATLKERGRLGAVHQFQDGVFDRPVLSADTVASDDAPEKE